MEDRIRSAGDKALTQAREHDFNEVDALTYEAGALFGAQEVLLYDDAAQAGTAGIGDDEHTAGTDSTERGEMMVRTRLDAIREKSYDYRRRWDFSQRTSAERLGAAFVDGAAAALTYDDTILEASARKLLDDRLPGWDAPGAVVEPKELLASYMRDTELVLRSAGLVPAEQEATVGGADADAEDSAELH